MTAILDWRIERTARFQHLRAEVRGGTLCLDRANDLTSANLRFQPDRPAELSASDCVARAIRLESDTDSRLCRAMLGLLHPQGWFANAEHGRRALDAPRFDPATDDADRALRTAGFRPWPKGKRKGSARGFRLKLGKIRLQILVGHNALELSLRKAKSGKRSILMRLSWQADSKSKLPQPFFWPDNLATPQHAIGLALHVAQDFLKDSRS